MHVVIIGAGQVGTSTAASLEQEHDVVVVEIDEDRAKQLQYELDVLTLAGNGVDIDVLEEAGVADADLFIACTSDDRANLVACGTARTLGDPFTVARTKAVEYLRTWERNNDAFDADLLLCTDLLTAENIVRVIGLPAAIDTDPFVDGLVQMAEFEIGADSPVTNQTIAEADRFESLTFTGLFRNGELLFPKGGTVIEPGDRAVVVGSPESVQSFARDIAPERTPDSADDVVLIGGSEIAFHTASLLEERSLEPRLIEADSSRARFLAEELPDTLVMEHDATDMEFLAREHVDEADIVVVSLDSDEKTLLISVLTKRLGADRVIAVVDTTEYVTLFEEVGIDVAINPREVTAEEIIRFTYESVAKNLSFLEDEMAEVLELELGPDSALVGTPIQDLDTEISAQFVIGAITRDGSLITPRGDVELEAGDSVVIFVETGQASEITALA
ncbi:MAG: Trk system potassium transporter TrkA [Halovenus sp.]